MASFSLMARFCEAILLLRSVTMTGIKSLCRVTSKLLFSSSSTNSSVLAKSRFALGALSNSSLPSFMSAIHSVGTRITWEGLALGFRPDTPVGFWKVRARVGSGSEAIFGFRSAVNCYN